MLTRKKLTENIEPSRVIGQKKVVTNGPIRNDQAKLKKPAVLGQTRRAAFGDLTNATSEPALPDKKSLPVKPLICKTNIVVNKATRPIVKKKIEVKKKTEPLANLLKKPLTSSLGSSRQIPTLKPSLPSQEQILKNQLAQVPLDRVEEDFSFVIIDDEDIISESDQPLSQAVAEKSLLAVDVENYTDVFNVGIYAQQIFDYYKCREKMFPIRGYLNKENDRVTASMRAVLVDWMVEVQENFELNHETLYLAVKLTDMYFSRVAFDKEKLQLVGAVTLFIAAKFDERCPPLIEDFTYISDNAFNRKQFIAMEIEVLKVVDFDLGIPISYTFLRRYAKVAGMSMETLTLARYILEMSLMESDLIVARDSMMAAAALYIAQKMKKEGAWEGDVIKSCGYTVDDFKHLIMALNNMLNAQPVAQLTTIRSKYSHQVFHKVAKIAPLPTEELLPV